MEKPLRSESECLTVQDFLEILCQAITTRLDEYQVGLSSHETVLVAQEWLTNTSLATHQPVEVVIATTPIEDASLAVVSELLADIAEERPGTYPFGHEATIPIPLPLILRTIHALSILINLMIANGRPHRVAFFAGAIGALTRITAQQVGEQTMSAPPQDEDVAFLMPQPGIAFCARLIENAARDIDMGYLAVDFGADDIDVEDFIIALRNDAQALRARNRQFGVNPNWEDG